MNSPSVDPVSRLRSGVIILCAVVVFAAAAYLPALAGADAKRIPAAKPAAAATALTTPLRLSYSYKVGDVRRYKVTGFFSGHFPPFAGAGSPAVHLMTVLDYAATVKKVTDKGAEIEFVVENAVVSLLEKEPVEGGAIKPEDSAELPLPLSQVQKLFNATAVIKPNGAISSIQGGDTSSVKIDLGIDLRKLFLVTAPITFSDKPVKPGDTWSFGDGLLGTNPGKTTYTGKLQGATSAGKRVTAMLSQDAQSLVDSKLDKDGNSTTNTAAMVGTLAGKVTLTGTTRLDAAPDPKAADAGASGRVTDGKLAMVVDLKRTMPDPEQAGKQAVTDIDIKARMYVSPAAVAKAKTAPAGKAAPAGKSVSDGKSTPERGAKSPKSGKL